MYVHVRQFFEAGKSVNERVLIFYGTSNRPKPYVGCKFRASIFIDHCVIVRTSEFRRLRRIENKLTHVALSLIRRYLWQYIIGKNKNIEIRIIEKIVIQFEPIK